MNIWLFMISCILTNNFIFSKFLGICPFLGVSSKVGTAASMGLAVTFVMTLASLICYMLNAWVLVPLGLEFMQTIVFILVIAVLVQLLEILLKKFLPPLYSALGIYLPLITTNCAVLGVTILNVESPYTYVESLFNSLGAGIGFLLAMVMFAGVRGKMESADIPKSLQGLPITLIAAAIVAMSMLGFAGLVEGIFGA